MRGENVAGSLGALHYIVALAILLDSIIFMSGFSPFFITKLAPTAYNILIIYCITAGSLLFCHPKLTSIWNKTAIELVISRRQQRAYRKKRCFSQIPNPDLKNKQAPLAKSNTPLIAPLPANQTP